MSSFEQKLLDKVEHLERQLEASQKECERLREIVEGMDLYHSRTLSIQFCPSKPFGFWLCPCVIFCPVLVRPLLVRTAIDGRPLHCPLSRAFLGCLGAHWCARPYRSL